MKRWIKSGTLATGLAMFAMFFGAGNIVFPLKLGQFAGSQNTYAVLGMLLTAVVMPIIGLISMILFQSNYQAFFYRLGKLPGTVLILLSLILLGPLFGIPRCITLTYGIFDYVFGDISLFWFSALSCIVIFLCAVSKNWLIDIIAYLLTPILLLFLGILIVKGVINSPATPTATELSHFRIFLHGLVEGYNTLDVLAALFFSTLILMHIHKSIPPPLQSNRRYVVKKVLQASFIGGGLLALVYLGMSYTTAFQSQHPALTAVSDDHLIAAVALSLLGDHAGIVAGFAVALACLTTAISLTVIFTEFIREHVVIKNKNTYLPVLIFTLLLSFSFSLLGFSGIVKTVVPIIVLVYPVYIGLAICNLAYQLTGFSWVKLPTLVILLVTAVVHHLFA